MSLDESIGTRGIKANLRNLSELLPNQTFDLYYVAALVAEGLPDEITPEGFIAAATSVLRKGYSHFTMSFPDVIQAACPTDFASKVNELWVSYAHQYIQGQK